MNPSLNELHEPTIARAVPTKTDLAPGQLLGSQTVTLYTNGLLAKVTRYAAGDPWTPLTQTDYAYDAHGRQWQAIDLRNGATTFWFNRADQISSTVTPDPGAGAQITTNFFDLMGRIWKTTLPDNTSVTNEFFPTGLLNKTHGSRTYPVEYTYDAQGRMKTMKTWTNYPSGNAATTTWNYNAYRGWLDNKRYADNQGPDYTYTAAGRLASRAWARGVTTTYSYNDAGDLSGVNYSDATPDVAYNYDRRGRQISIAQSGGTAINRSYNDAGQLLVESYSGGPLDGLSVTNGYDSLLRRAALGLASLPAPLAEWAYDPYTGRLQTVTSGEDTATYSYVANSPLVDNLVFKHDGNTRMTTVKRYDALNRLTSITNEPGDAGAIGFRYVYNDANQRTTVTNADSSRWVYTYDKLGQVISGGKYWGDNTPVAGQQFEYAFDDIGNRRTNGFGGNEAGLSLRESRYTVNDLNQYTSRTVPGYVNVLGDATNTASVSVNTNLAYRKDRYFRAELSVDNTTDPVWLGITNVAVMPVGSGNYVVSNVTGHVLWPKTPETFTHDADGNLTSDSLWTNVWNGENRRIVIERRSDAPSLSKVKEAWTLLADGRWIERIVSTNNGMSYYPSQTNRYVWDNQVLLAVLDHTNGVVVSFLRGIDMSGSIQGAGGVGGVLAVKAGTSAQCDNMANTTHFTCYDGNGNVMALVNAATGAESARYEYGPFAEPLRIIGPMAKLNPIRFSTQYHDDYTGDDKYLFRDLRDGRWPNRDPIGEKSFLTDLIRRNPEADEDKLYRESLMPEYLFVRNNPITWIDRFGLDADITWSPAPCPKGQIMSFVQVGSGGWGAYKDPFVDDGSKGFGAKGTGCPEYPDFGHPGIFEDSPSGLTGPVKFVVCRVCIEICCGNKRSIVSVGPCKQWKKGDTGDLGSFSGTEGPPDMSWILTVKKKYPNAFVPGKCYDCKNPSGK